MHLLPSSPDARRRRRGRTPLKYLEHTRTQLTRDTQWKTQAIFVPLECAAFSDIEPKYIDLVTNK